jgi:hypothetical protein
MQQMTMEQFHLFLKENPEERAALIKRFITWLKDTADAEPDEVQRAIDFLEGRFLRILEGEDVPADEQNYLAYLSGHLKFRFYADLKTLA